MVFECYSGGVWLVFGGVWVELDSIWGGGFVFCWGCVWLVFANVWLLFGWGQGCVSQRERADSHSVVPLLCTGFPARP